MEIKHNFPFPLNNSGRNGEWAQKARDLYSNSKKGEYLEFSWNDKDGNKIYDAICMLVHTGHIPKKTFTFRGMPEIDKKFIIRIA